MMIDLIAIYTQRAGRLTISTTTTKIYDTPIVNLIRYFINKYIILDINFDFLKIFFDGFTPPNEGRAEKRGVLYGLQDESFYILKCKRKKMTNDKVNLTGQIDAASNQQKHAIQSDF